MTGAGGTRCRTCARIICDCIDHAYAGSVVIGRGSLGIVDERFDGFDPGIADIEANERAACAPGSLGSLGLPIGEPHGRSASRAFGVHPDIIERVGHGSQIARCSTADNSIPPVSQARPASGAGVLTFTRDTPASFSGGVA